MVAKTQMYAIPQYKETSAKIVKDVKITSEVHEEIVDKNAPLVKPTFWVRRENYEWKHSIAGAKNRAMVENGMTLGANYIRNRSV